ncbi:putative transcriptional regulator [Ignisphaera aggregans DSM 17230]|uniref:Putative transcriptional regulator n=1 Tax=Ignisphaera aggregans (strain DSM 17230 / JCM 13409 / AQ1.S1) TaxID=583356 RepID=E0SNN2_IGNAA|nr:putative transcriptional regulator [Ignisphaera aggregans DSM 17230]
MSEIQTKEVVLPIEIPVAPLSRREMKQLEVALIIGTVLRKDVLQSIMNREEVTTWLDSLAVAAAAFAMDKAGYPLSQIANELGRTEATIRKHLKGETKAGQLVKETYEMLVRGELKISIPIAGVTEDINKLMNEVESLRKENSLLKDKLNEIVNIVSSGLSELQKIEEGVKKVREIFQQVIQK